MSTRRLLMELFVACILTSIVILGIIFLASRNPNRNMSNAEIAVREVAQTVYVKDLRTNQCFAYSPQSRTLTWVPCDNIERPIQTPSHFFSEEDQRKYNLPKRQQLELNTP